MTAGWCFRTTRAAVFAAVCVLLAALGHVLMSDTTVPWWALGGATAVVGGAVWCLAGRERGLLLVSSAVLAAQTALHTWFSYAQELAAGSGSPGAGPHPVTPVAPVTSAAHAHHLDHTTHGAHTDHAAHAVTGAGHTLEGMSSAGMLAAHLLAALLCGLWLAHGERAAFRILRAVAGWLAAPLRLPLALPAPPHRPRVAARRGRDARTPRGLLLVHTITSRGPPTGTAVA
ncbi:hypothetical protein ACFW3A_30605 [Streptomyces pilosus]|uniref:hypothetical protein n=1 Tax=Streptomyces pilosus TaxID=28893 RepID=UPI00362F50EE